MKNLKLISTLILLYLVKILSAQQQSLQSQYILNPFIANPGVAGTDKYGNFSTSYRSQWTGYKGAPETFYLTGHMPLNRSMDEYHHHSHNTNWISAGGKIFFDQLGPIRTMGIYASGAYNITLSKGRGEINDRDYIPGLKLSMGLDFGIINYRFDTDYFSNYTMDLVDQDVTYLNMASNQSSVHPDGNLGLYLYKEKRYFVGLSMTQIFGNRILSNSAEFTSDLTDNFQLSRHIYLMAGYHYSYNEKISLEPSMMLRTVTGGGMAFDANLKVNYLEKYWVGASYRIGRAAGLMLGGLFAEKYEISYMYELNTSALMSTNYGTHEITLTYRLPIKHTISNPADNLD